MLLISKCFRFRFRCGGSILLILMGAVFSIQRMQLRRLILQLQVNR